MKIVALSDTHGKNRQVEVPEGDVLIYAGDFEIREIPDLLEMRDWLNEMSHKYVITTFGNHDFTDHLSEDRVREIFGKKIIYLCNNMVEIEGLKIWGSSYTTRFMDWGWMKFDHDLKKIWDTIPYNLDICITHGMPYGILDKVLPKMESVGSFSLRERIKEVKPKIFIGGHLHESYGQYTDGTTDYYNVAILNENYQIENPCTIINI